MNKPQRIIQIVMATLIVIAAVVCHYYGVPDWIILLVAGFMLANLLLQAFWMNNSVIRAIVLMIVSTLFSLFLIWYLFKVPLVMVFFGAIFLFVIMVVNVILMKNSTATSKARIAQWAAENGWELLECEHRFDTGPFGGIHWRAQMYFEFVICDQQQKRHTGWAHFDHSLFGGGRYEVKWVESPEHLSNEK
ncbi:MAG: hypothetical protein IPG76_00300 [Acidobacteria bacterium]|nr:hypothetical protein [Acidobacteriota bacterium]